MQFLALSITGPDTDPTAMAPYLDAEAAQAWRYYLDGFIRQAYFATPPAAPRAVLVVEADSLDDAQSRLAALPLRRAGLVTFEVTPIGPFLPWAALLATAGAGIPST